MTRSAREVDCAGGCRRAMRGRRSRSWTLCRRSRALPVGGELVGVGSAAALDESLVRRAARCISYLLVFDAEQLAHLVAEAPW